MNPDTTASLRTWINSNNTIKIIPNTYVVHVTYEGITNFATLAYFDKKIIESLPAPARIKSLR